ncbi:hypothetical protein E4U42_002613 [Claviceps africana]|uniref:Sodium/calcium exchanger membrane region domain-containing protein n=1 Tax=Claviceps africana TaxID=83212 RepID=A0A8K0NKZ8_9HYPO|nr:hypothetical protein E4U42_002613 [Claviceps africana]
MAVNHFKNKRAAHNIHRNQADHWNPFRHVSWGNRERRRETWTGSELEAQQPDVEDGNGEKLTHAATAPTPASTGAMLGSSLRSGTDNTVNHNLATQADQGATRRDADHAYDVSTLTSSPADAGSVGVLRSRKTEDDATKTDGPARSLEAEDVSASASADDNNNGKTKEKKEGFIRHVHPKEPFTVANQLQRTFLNSWINILIIAAPVGIALKYTHVNGIAVFIVNFIAIIPLAAMLSYATEEVALRTGETLGGLINATFGNAVELIVAVIALADGKVAIVQTSLIGSILSNLLLVMGFCFFCGGLRRQEQHFNHTVAQTAASLLALAAASVIVPSVFEVAAPNVSQSDIAKMSRGTSVILLIVYGAYLFFQLKTHQKVFNEESQKVAAKPWSHGAIGNGAVKQGLAMPSALMGYAMTDQNENQRLSRMLMNQRLLEAEDDEEGEDPQLHFFVALAALTVSTVIIAFCAECMVDSIDEVTKNGGLKEEFVGLILLPIVGNAAEHATAVTVAIKDKMDLAIGVAVGSSMQVALFLIPLLVIIGWIMGNQNMDLSFDMFQVAVMFVAVLLTNYLIGDGKSHWLEGFLLICLYSIIAVCSFCKKSFPVPHLTSPHLTSPKDADRLCALGYPDSQLDKANGGASS